MLYETPNHESRERLEEMLKSQDPAIIQRGLVSAALFEPDWQWVEAACQRFAQSMNPELRKTAAVCLGHIARLHQRFSSPDSLIILRKLALDSESNGEAEDALDDVQIYIKPGA